MLSHRLMQDQERISNVFEKAVYLDECLQLISEEFPSLELCLIKLSKGGSSPAAANQDLTNYLKQLRNKINAIDPRELFKALDMLSHEFTYGPLSVTPDESDYPSVEHELNEFSEKYTEYIKSYTPESAIVLVNKARVLREELRWYLAGIKAFNLNQPEGNIDITKYSEISVLFTSTMTVKEFTRKLEALDRIYHELCNLLDVSLADYPLQIIKIESGSLWAKVFGNPVVIPFIKDILLKGFGFAYRNFTKEGKLSAVPKNVEAVESVLGLSQKLKDNGVEVTEMEEHIRKSAVTIAKDLNTLISGEAEIVVDSQVISVGQEVQKTLVQNSEILKLDHDNSVPASSKLTHDGE